MKQIMLHTQIPHDIFRPSLTARLKGDAKPLTIYAAKESRKIAEVFAARKKRLRALKEDDPGFHGLRYFKSSQPSLPYLLGLTEGTHRLAVRCREW
ncbi:MAG: hypothetical protein M3O20_15565 [Acidobacteriota bacterium]|nr:hypothetical protein [Acidobacteriota bacterium]